MYVSVQTRAAGATVGRVDGFKMQEGDATSSSVGMCAACICEIRGRKFEEK